MRSALFCFVLILLLPLLLTACGGPKSAQVVANEYVGYMKGGKFLEAAQLWDYQTEARQQNENWDEIVESQRRLIIGKLAEEKAKTLEMWATYFPMETKVIQVMESGDSAKVSLEGGRVSSLDLIKDGENWKVAGMN